MRRHAHWEANETERCPKCRRPSPFVRFGFGQGAKFALYECQGPAHDGFRFKVTPAIVSPLMKKR